IRLILRRTIAAIASKCPKNRRLPCEIPCFGRIKSPRKDILRLVERVPFHHIVAARYCGSAREAAALLGRFLPELGRFGFEAAFFLARVFGLAFLGERSELRKAGPASSPHRGRGRCAAGGVARAHVLAHAPRDALAQQPKSIALGTGASANI
ncbi:MAG TPA: hypothetical protein VGM68_01325, partial [Rhizomicrobium sp.]